MTGPVFCAMALVVGAFVLLFAINRFFESIVLFAKVQAVRARICGMTCENEARDRMGLAKAYSDTEFFDAHDELKKLVEGLT